MVTVYDVAMAEGHPWIVMELVRGLALSDVLEADGPVSPRRAAEIGGRVLAALRVAHERGVLHRDVKPGNVLIGNDGRIVLTDFGIAAIEGTSAITLTGEVVGSPEYLSPERALGRPAGPGSDLWSLGVLLYTAVEGGSPFRRTTALSTLRAVVDEPLPPPQRAGPLAPVIEGLLRKEPADRLDGADAQRMLDAVAAGRAPYTPTIAGPPTPVPSPSLPPPSSPPATGPYAAPTAPTPIPSTTSTVSDRVPYQRRAAVAIAAGALALALAAGGVAWALLDDGGGGTVDNGGSATSSGGVTPSWSSDDSTAGSGSTAATAESSSAGATASSSSRHDRRRLLTGPAHRHRRGLGRTRHLHRCLPAPGGVRPVLLRRHHGQPHPGHRHLPLAHRQRRRFRPRVEDRRLPGGRREEPDRHPHRALLPGGLRHRRQLDRRGRQGAGVPPVQPRAVQGDLRVPVSQRQRYDQRNNRLPDGLMT